MKLSTQLIYVTLCTCLLTGTAQATLVDRGGGLIYDTDLDVTWLAYANYGAGSSYDNGYDATDGRMTWDNAQDWATTLTYGGFTDWHLPSSDTCSGPDCNGSEMGHLFYSELGGVAGDAIDTTNDPSAFALFIDFAAGLYWSGTTSDSSGNFAWTFDFSNGEQNEKSKESDNTYYVLAVRDGDVGAQNIPEPASLALLAIGFAALGTWRRARN